MAADSPSVAGEETPFVHLATDQFAAAAARGWQAVRDIGIKLKPSSDLYRILTDAEWIGASKKDLWDTDGRVSEDKHRFLTAVNCYEQVVRLAWLLEQAALIEGVGPQARRWIQGRIDHIRSASEDAQNFLWELELAARLRAVNLEVKFAEPDIQIVFAESLALSIACKRPKSFRQLGTRIREARRQIERQGSYGLIAVSLDALVNTDVGSGKLIVRIGETAAELKQMCIGEHDRVIGLDRVSKAVTDAFESDLVCGVLLASMTTGVAKVPSTTFWNWRLSLLPKMGSVFSPSLQGYLRENLVLNGIEYGPTSDQAQAGHQRVVSD